jgi:transcriptional regulator with XRE-family HTH domain
MTCQPPTDGKRVRRARGKDLNVETGRLGRNLRHLLGLHDVSQQDLARYLGLSPQGLWNILHGRSEPRSRTAHSLAVAFGVNLDVLFADTGTCVRAAAAVFERAPVRAVAEQTGTAAAAI